MGVGSLNAIICLGTHGEDKGCKHFEGRSVLLCSPFLSATAVPSATPHISASLTCVEEATLDSLTVPKSLPKCRCNLKALHHVKYDFCKQVHNMLKPHWTQWTLENLNVTQ